MLNGTDKPYHRRRSVEFARLARSKRVQGLLTRHDTSLNGQLLKAFRAHSRLRVAAVLLCLLACTLQSFVAQTHVHSRRSSTPDSISYQAGGSSDAALRLSIPDDDDSPKHGRRDAPTSCPLCQIVLHGGAAPALSFALSLPVLAATSFAPAEQVPTGTVVAVSFSWQGRAPPLT